MTRWTPPAGGGSGSSSRSRAAVLLAGALAYTSFSASSPATSPSQLLRDAHERPLLPAHRHGACRARCAAAATRCTSGCAIARAPLGARQLRGRRARAVPRGPRGDRHRAPPGSRVRRRAGLADHQVPVEVHRDGGRRDRRWGGCCSRRRWPSRPTGSARRCTAHARGASDWVESGRRARLRAGRRAHAGVRDPRGGVPALGLQPGGRGRAFEHHHAGVLPGGRRVVGPGGIAAAVGVAAVGVVEPRAVGHARAAARGGRLGSGRAARLRGLLHDAAAVPRGSVRAPASRSRSRASGSARCCAIRA